MKKLLVILPLLVVLSAVLSGCADYIPIPEDYSMPVVGAEEVYDDIVPTPGGVAYRANVHHVGGKNPWPPVESADVTLRGWFGKVCVGYRDYIETEAGETRNNIFYASRYGGFWGGSLRLYATAVPPGIELSQHIGGGLPGSLVTVLVIEIATEVAPGQYRLEIGVQVECQNCGTVPCVIEVVE